MNLNLEIAMYEIHQMVLTDKDLLDERGIPLKLKKPIFEETDAIALYEILAHRISGSKRSDFTAAKNEFNKYAKGMHDEVYLNMYLMSLFILDHYVADQNVSSRILIGGKITRLINYLRAKLIEVDERGPEVITDSSMAASNIYRAYNNLPELTREVRAGRLAKWRNVAKNKKK